MIRAAHHEAGHVVAYHVRGALVQWVSLGACYAEPATDPVALLAGAECAVLAGFDDHPSNQDERLLVAAWRHHGQTARWRAAQEREARTLLRAHWPAVEAVAAQLQLRGMLTGSQCAKIMRAAMAAEARRAADAYRTGPYAVGAGMAS